MTTRNDLIERFAENFGVDLNNQIEAALAAQEADHVLDLLATRDAKAETLRAQIRAIAKQRTVEIEETARALTTRDTELAELRQALDVEQQRIGTMAYQRGAIFNAIHSMPLAPTCTVQQLAARIEEILRAGMTAEVKRGWEDEIARLTAERNGAQEAVTTAGANSPITMLQLAGHGYTGHGHRCCKQAPTDQKPRTVAKCSGPNVCQLCSADVDDIHAQGSAPPAIWCRRCNVIVGPEQLDKHNREHHGVDVTSELPPSAVADAWNAAYPVGTLVRYWRGIRETEPSGTGRTRSEAWPLGGHTPVVLIEGTSGGIALTHVEVIAEQDQPDQTREQVIARAKPEHDKTCSCDPRYLLSCPNMAAAILKTKAPQLVQEADRG